MAAGGGTFLVQNKVLPGAYINFVSRERALGTLGERGVVALAWASDWGKEKVVEVTAQDFQTDSLSIFGYSYTDETLVKIRELFKGASSLLLYRLGSGEKAKATIGNLTVTAVCGGTRGNDIQILIQEQLGGKLEVVTMVADTKADTQEVETIEELKENAFVSFAGTGALTETAGTKLTGGTNKTVTGNDYSEFLSTIETESFTTLLYAGDDEVTKGLFSSFTERLRDNEGYKITTVLHNYPKADFEGVISVKNEISADKTALVYWVAGQTAGAEVNQSLTNKTYDGEYLLADKYKKSELTECIQKGEFVLYGEKGVYRVLKDINTFVSYVPTKNSDFSNNQIIRVLDAIANDTARIFSDYYLGKVQNNEIGRDFLKNELVNYIKTLQAIEAIENFSSDDITIEKGTEKGDVVVKEAVQPVGCMEKLYMSVIAV